MISRRGFLFGVGATLAVVRTPELLMPIKSIEIPTLDLEGAVTGRWSSKMLPPGNYNMTLREVIEQSANLIRMTFQLENGMIIHSNLQQVSREDK